jgi:membrane dipeptidase
MKLILPDSPHWHSIEESPQKQREENHGPKRLYVDAHVDLPYFMMHQSEDVTLNHLNQGPFTLQGAFEAGFRLFFTAIYCADRFNGAPAFQNLQTVLRYTREHYDKVEVIKDRKTLDALTADPFKMGTVLLLENADALAGNYWYIGNLRDEGILLVGLTHAGKNRLGDGNAVFHSDGLTDTGREVIEALQDHGLVIDVAHLHPKCFWQLLDITEAPLVTSHTGVRNINKNPRNIDFEQAREIIGRNGMIGLSFNPELLSESGQANIDSVFSHLDTLVQKFGPDGIGIGSDFCGYDGSADGLEDVRKVSDLTPLMREHGYDEKAIEGILGLNWLGFLEKHL